MNLHSDQRGLVAGWAVKLIIFLALLGIVIYDGAAIAVNMFQLDGISHEVAVEVAEEAGGETNSIPVLERSAKKIAAAHDTQFVSLKLSDDKEVLRVTVRRDASTVVVNQVDQVSDWGQTEATGKSFTN
jgi:hypothetical protein